MQLSLEGVNKKVGPETWLHSMDIAPRSGAVTVLLGATQAGKTSLMRIMAGLDVPSGGRVLVDGRNVVGTPVRDRQRVQELAEKLHIEMFLDRYPAELSGGQQQRVALARALAKGAPLMLLDEPLVNLDYKLREELRDELTALFAVGSSTVIYATTEPGEALLLGGYTAVMDAGELLQYGPTAEVFHQPKSLRVAKAFSDPPMNLLAANGVTGGVQLVGGPLLAINLKDVATQQVTVGIRASSRRVHAGSGSGNVALAGKVELAEISGSDTYVHVSTVVGELVAQLTGVHRFELGAPLTLYVDPALVYLFDSAGALTHAPRRGEGH